MRPAHPAWMEMKGVVTQVGHGPQVHLLVLEGLVLKAPKGCRVSQDLAFPELMGKTAVMVILFLGHKVFRERPA